jgi:glycerophosphoryl diester phosphodiesterase
MSAARSRPLLLGHRGARGLRSIRENTISSFDRALADGCDGFEFDVRRAADGEPLIWHDPESDGKPIEQSAAHQLPRLERLEGILERYRDSAFLDIELKVTGLEEITIELLRKFPPRRGLVVSSFLPGVIKAVHVGDSRIPLGLICERKIELSLWRELPVACVMAHSKLVTRALYEDLKAAGKKLFVWTVNHPARMRQLRDLGIDGIISDKPKLLCQTLRD